jgi:hypothetical protein
VVCAIVEKGSDIRAIKNGIKRSNKIVVFMI